jgi:hypothetical protein
MKRELGRLYFGSCVQVIMLTPLEIEKGTPELAQILRGG